MSILLHQLTSRRKIYQQVCYKARVIQSLWQTYESFKVNCPMTRFTKTFDEIEKLYDNFNQKELTAEIRRLEYATHDFRDMIEAFEGAQSLYKHLRRMST